MSVFGFGLGAEFDFVVRFDLVVEDDAEDVMSGSAR